MKKERNKRANILICIAALLLCAALLSIHLAGGLLAGFSKTENGSDSARVAEFNITEEGTFFETMEIAVVPGSSQSNAITIKNSSEVSVACTLKVKKDTDNLPALNFTLKPKDEPTSGTFEEPENGVCTTNCQLPIDESKEYVLEVVWPQVKGGEEDDLAKMGMVDSITVSVKAVQID